MKRKVKITESEIKRSVRRGLMEKILLEDYEMKDTYSRSRYKQSPREEDIEGVFGQYGEEIPPSVLRYMRKNPKRIIERLYKVYGQQMFDYISQNLQTPELDLEVEDEINVSEEVEDTLKRTTYSKSDVDQARNSGVGIKVDGTVVPTKDGGLEVTKSMSESSDWMQHVSDEIEEDGTEGTFREYCLKKGFRNGCSTGCMEEALRSNSTKLHYRAGLAHAFCTAKR